MPVHIQSVEAELIVTQYTCVFSEELECLLHDQLYSSAESQPVHIMYHTQMQLTSLA